MRASPDNAASLRLKLLWRVQPLWVTFPVDSEESVGTIIAYLKACLYSKMGRLSPHVACPAGEGGQSHSARDTP